MTSPVSKKMHPGSADLAVRDGVQSMFVGRSRGSYPPQNSCSIHTNPLNRKTSGEQTSTVGISPFGLLVAGISPFGLIVISRAPAAPVPAVDRALLTGSPGHAPSRASAIVPAVGRAKLTCHGDSGHRNVERFGTCDAIETDPPCLTSQVCQETKSSSQALPLPGADRALTRSLNPRSSSAPGPGPDP